MRALIAAEWFKVTRRPMTWIALGILLAIMATLRLLLIALSFVSLPSAPGQEMPTNLFADLVTLPGAIADSVNFLPSTGIFALLVVAASFAGTEFAWGTIVPLLARGASRTRFVLAKALVALVVALLYLIATTVVGLVLGAIASQLHHGQIPLEWLQRDWREFLLALLRAYWATVPYVLAALAIALVFRSSALAMGMVLAYVIVEQVGLGVLQLLRPMIEDSGFSWLFTLLDWTLLGQNASTLQALNTRAFLPTGLAEQATSGDLHPWRAAVVLAAYSFAFLLAALVAVRRDIPTRPTSA
ncbi:MAG: ABC transporter permease [Thermomicrobium sp.]|nr:ABC transporter permease [Thermomicrobium sp.]